MLRHGESSSSLIPLSRARGYRGTVTQAAMPSCTIISLARQGSNLKPDARACHRRAAAPAPPDRDTMQPTVEVQVASELATAAEPGWLSGSLIRPGLPVTTVTPAGASVPHWQAASDRAAGVLAESDSESLAPY